MNEKLRLRIEKNGDKTNDIIKRLRSIDLDRMFVMRELLKIPDIPIFANERCGNWYCYDYYTGTCYFKSTDGHRGKWTFNDRRLNIDSSIEAFNKGGLAIIDSTGNRKKKIPDSQSKTIPIWLYILNNALGNDDEDIPLQLPLTISIEEKEEIINHLKINKKNWITLLRNVVSPEIYRHLTNISRNTHTNKQRILKPVWVYNDNPIITNEIADIKKNGDIPIILISASDPNIKEQWYLMGSADDEEMWSAGLTPETFYQNKELLFSCVNDKESYSFIQQIIEKKQSTVDNIFPKISLFNGFITICSYPELSYDNHITINLLKYKSESPFQFIFDINLYQKLGIVAFLKKLDEFIRCNNKEQPIVIYANTKEIGMIVSLGIIFMHSSLKDNFKLDILTKSEIRRIISYIQHVFDLKHFSRDICKQFNIYFIQ
jgi:hypothetical protein